MRRYSKYILTILLVFLFSACGKEPDLWEKPMESTGTDVGATDTNTTPHISLSLPSGFYETAQEITLSCNVEGAVIYYTLDGSTPNKESALYQAPIPVENRTNTPNLLSAQLGISAGNDYIPDFPVDKATVIRAIAYLPDGRTTPQVQATYFVGLEEEKYGEVPIISLGTEFENLFDYETGIYTLGKTYDEWLAEDPSRADIDGWQREGNYSNRGREWERPVSVELITRDGSAGFMQQMGVRIMGGASRNQAQKSLKLIAREEYGEKNLRYELIPGNLDEGGNIIDKYKSFVLRVGGNDADYARLRDPFLQTLVSDADFMTQQTTPCVVFINGEYWGMYTITEDYTDNHFENNYGVDNKNVIVIKRGELEEGNEENTKDLNLFRDMFLYITRNDMSEPVFYEAACELVDMESFADYFAFELYIANEDTVFENNNWRMWRVREDDMATEYSDGRWRFAAYDNDFSTGIYAGPESALEDNISHRIAKSSDKERKSNIKHYHTLELFRSLLQNEDFENRLILALCDMRNIYFAPRYTFELMEEMSPAYLQLVPDTLRRFGPGWVAEQNVKKYYAGKVEELSRYLSNRYTAMPEIIREAFDLGKASKLAITANDASKGTVLLNKRELDIRYGFSGMYFPETIVSVQAIPAEGHKFVGWKVKSDLQMDTTKERLEFTVGAPVELEAVFVKE